MGPGHGEFKPRAREARVLGDNENQNRLKEENKNESTANHCI
jgi:hypothetical protein